MTAQPDTTEHREVVAQAIFKVWMPNWLWDSQRPRLREWFCTVADAAIAAMRVEATELRADEKAQIAEAIYRGRVRNCEETVEDWPGEDTLLCRVLRGESERFVDDAAAAIGAVIAARHAALLDELDTLRPQAGAERRAHVLGDCWCRNYHERDDFL